MSLREHGVQPGGKLAAPVEIFEQRIPLATRAGTNPVKFRIEGIRQFLSTGVVRATRTSKHGAGSGAQVLAKMSDEKFPGLLNSLAASAGQKIAWASHISVGKPKIRGQSSAVEQQA